MGLKKQSVYVEWRQWTAEAVGTLSRYFTSNIALFMKPVTYDVHVMYAKKVLTEEA